MQLSISHDVYGRSAIEGQAVVGLAGNGTDPPGRPLAPAPVASAAELQPIVCQTDLLALSEHVRYSAWLGLDMEMDNQHSYPERVCLLQVATDTVLRLVDPLAPLDLRVLFDAFERRGPCGWCGATSSRGVDYERPAEVAAPPRLHPLCAARQCCTPHRIVLHGGSYDVRMLDSCYQYRPSRLFDTSIAAAVLGEQRSALEVLVATHFGVALDKQYQRTNWRLRPLALELLNYAVNDIRYLQPLAQRLEAQLYEAGKMPEHNAKLQKMVEDAYRPKPLDPERCWRVKGAHELAPTALAVLRSLWHWREAAAVERDTPPFTVVRNELLCHLARKTADAGWVEDYCANRDLRPLWPGMLQALRAGLAVPPEEQPIRNEELLWGKAKPKAKPKAPVLSPPPGVPPSPPPHPRTPTPQWQWIPPPPLEGSDEERFFSAQSSPDAP
eukprot:EG_transcript_13192